MNKSVSTPSGPSRSGLLLRLRTTTSLLSLTGAIAVLVPGGIEPTQAGNCAVTVIAPTAAVTNSTAINCIKVDNTTVNGNVTNASPGIITAGSGTTDSGIILDNSTVAGVTINNGKITATSGQGIEIENSALLLSGIINTGSIVAKNSAIHVGPAATVAGGINNIGVISGGYGVRVDGNISGGITNGGTIAGGLDGVSINAATLSGGIVNNGTISGGNAAIILYQAPLFTGGIVNNGTIATLSAGGSGVLVESGSLFTGGIVNTGTIAANVDAILITNTSTFLGGITNTGKIAGGNVGVYVGGSVFAGGISNGGIIAGGHGIDVLVSTFTGDISNTGTIAGALGIFTTTKGIIIFDSGVIVGTGGTAIQFGGPTNTLTLGPGFSISGVVQGSNSDILQLGGAGTGTFDLSTIGNTKQFQGFNTFNVVSGTWYAINTFGQTQPWTVEGGTLAGTGTLSAVNVNSGGTLAPGGPGAPGTLRIGGNLVMASGATFLANVSPQGASQAKVTGSAAVAGSVQVAAQPGFYAAGTKLAIVVANGGVNGTFSNLAAPSAVSAGLSYDANDVYLTIQSNPLLTQLPSGAPTNPRNVAAAVDATVSATGTPPPGLQGLFGLPAQTIQNELTQLSGEAATGAQGASFQLMGSFLSLLTSNGGGAAAPGGQALPFEPEPGGGLPADAALAYDTALKAPAMAVGPRWNGWGSGFGGSNATQGDPTVLGSHDMTARVAGAAAGVDYRISPETVVGFALAGGGTNWGLSAGLGGGRSDSLLAGVYGSTRSGAAYLSGALTYGSHWMSTSRTINVVGSDTLAASFNGQSLGGRLEGGYRVPAALAFGITPYAAIQAQSLHSPDYTETGTLGPSDPLALTFDTRTAWVVRSELGSRFSQTFMSSDSSRIDLFGRIAWAHDWQTDPSLTAAFLGTPLAGFVVNGATPPSNLALVTAGAEWRLTNGWSLLAKFDSELAAGSQTYAGTGTLRHAW